MNNTDRNDASRPISIWRWPLILGIASAVGLLSALIGDDVYDVLSWCLLALPLIMIVRAMRSAQ
ncbi:hypothetical protein [Oxalicibacterium solurbis]|uniref:DUF4175 domain-containing protein n=1 Tax=Oxalicibacterium solurbis TaxID=69280 RepID=A0A8J3B4X9_9BURK|nr:hypothetical protein [Oxalicibacterium solurbis]GGI55178.1 hypothetical protein GCM10011430_23520 [Oxalicibacterium solurbis]